MVSSAVGAPLPSRIALVATVHPCSSSSQPVERGFELLEQAAHPGDDRVRVVVRGGGELAGGEPAGGREHRDVGECAAYVGGGAGDDGRAGHVLEHSRLRLRSAGPVAADRAPAEYNRWPDDWSRPDALGHNRFFPVQRPSLCTTQDIMKCGRSRLDFATELAHEEATRAPARFSLRAATLRVARARLAGGHRTTVRPQAVGGREATGRLDPRVASRLIHTSRRRPERPYLWRPV